MAPIVSSRDYDASADSILPSHNYAAKDPMSSNNPYASNGSQPYGNQPKKSRKKLWWIIAIIVAIVVIVAAVLGGVLGTRKSSSSSSSSKDNSSGTSGGSSSSGADRGSAYSTGTVGASTGNTALPTLLDYLGSNMAAQTQTGVDGQVYLAVATDTYMLPAYATGVRLAALKAHLPPEGVCSWHSSPATLLTCIPDLHRQPRYPDHGR